jgi:hypothetical protein
MLLAITAGPIASEILVIAAILIVLYIVLKMGKVIIGLVLNSVLGLIAIYAVNTIFNLGILYNLLTIVVVAIFGLPAVAIIIILKLIGISI